MDQSEEGRSVRKRVWETKLVVQVRCACSTEANCVPGFKQRTDHLAQISIVGQQRMNMMFELASRRSGNDETKRLHQAPDLVRQLCAKCARGESVPLPACA